MHFNTTRERTIAPVDCECAQRIAGVPRGPGASLVATLAVAAFGALGALGASLATASTPTAASGSAAAGAPDFWTALRAHCGRAYAGRLLEAPAGDETFADRALVMHVRSCNDAEIRIPFHVGDDRSRTWVLTPTPTGFRLKHDHRHEDGSEDDITQYGGDSATRAGLRQEFRADAHTAALIPAAATNVWTVEVVPGRTFTYALRREGTERRFRIEFDLTRAVEAPPAPWGAD